MLWWNFDDSHRLSTTIQGAETWISGCWSPPVLRLFFSCHRFRCLFIITSDPAHQMYQSAWSWEKKDIKEKSEFKYGGTALVSAANELLLLFFCPQSSTTPYYTFYYDTGFSDEEEIEEQVLRNTVNSEALMTAFHHNQPGTNGNKVREEEEFGLTQIRFTQLVHRPQCVCVCVGVRAWSRPRSGCGRITSQSSAAASTCFAQRRSRGLLPWGYQSRCAGSCGWRCLVREGGGVCVGVWTQLGHHFLFLHLWHLFFFFFKRHSRTPIAFILV